MPNKTYSKAIKTALSCVALSLAVAGVRANAEDAPAETFKLGLDLYRGVSNISGVNAQTTDGLWAGSGYAFPSNVSLNWANGDSQTAKVSFGFGDMYSTHTFASLNQPVEAYYKTKSGKDVKITVGKFYVPFGIQEWEYETKWGGQAEVTKGAYGFTAAVTYNNNTKKPNEYLRAGRQCGADTNIGISFSDGRGLTYNTDHKTALGVDLTHNYKGFTLASEYFAAVKSSDHPFQFAFAKVTYNKLGIFTPYVAGYYWHDPLTGQTGIAPSQFSSAVVGLNVKLTKELALENAYSRANGRNLWWSQAHISF